VTERGGEALTEAWTEGQARTMAELMAMALDVSAKANVQARV
jgi:hypothetical protein